jgi:hypothetical protein
MKNVSTIYGERSHKLTIESYRSTVHTNYQYHPQIKLINFFSHSFISNILKLDNYLNTYRPESASEFDNLKKTIIKYYLEEYIGIDV